MVVLALVQEFARTELNSFSRFFALSLGGVFPLPEIDLAIIVPEDVVLRVDTEEDAIFVLFDVQRHIGVVKIENSEQLKRILGLGKELFLCVFKCRRIGQFRQQW